MRGGLYWRGPTRPAKSLVQFQAWAGSVIQSAALAAFVGLACLAGHGAFGILECFACLFGHVLGACPGRHGIWFGRVCLRVPVQVNGHKSAIHVFPATIVSLLHLCN